MTERTPAPRGRPRSAASEAAVLKAAEALMDELRPAQISADAIAHRSGVSKATLYKWWPSKTHILLDAVLHRAGRDMPLPDTGSTLEDFIQLLSNFVIFHQETSFGATVAHLFAEGMNDPDILRLYNERYASTRRAAIRVIWERGVARGEIRGDVDPEMGLDMLYGTLTYRYLSGHAPVDTGFAERVVRAVFEGVRGR